LAFRFVPIPYDAGPWTQAKNLDSYIDTLLGFQFNRGGWVTINALSTAAHTMWGAICGWILISDREEKRKLLFLVAAGVSSLIVGYILSPITPIVKCIATSTFVLASGGWCFLILAFLYWIVYMRGYKDWTIIVDVVGINSIFIYI
jgi:predicted acyltransferase